MNNQKAERLDLLMQEQIALIDKAIDRARADEVMNIDVLNKQIDRICADSASLNEEEGKHIEIRMTEMIGKLEELAIELKALQDRAGTV